MPRPGPRPYECVRRAWHSDRHQPIRGSLIKEIFRVANEIHSSSTKQNKEWQEKLPTVVLRAEEIMYSKANSEAEYMDLKTLWDRTNDAINTIIRREEGSETGQFLQPCIEAALNLGCTPRRSSRSQRNCHPRCYLGSNTAAEADRSAANCSNLARTPQHLSSDPRSSFAAVPNNIPPRNFPLYYGNIPQFETVHRGFVLSPNPVTDSVKNTQPRNINIASLEPSKIGACDLSLRLGPRMVMVPSPSGAETELPRDVEDVRSRIEKGVSFFPRGDTNDSLDSLERAEAAMRKRKAEFDQPLMIEDQRFCLRPKLPFGHFS